jgi:hypothetical protein
MAKPYFWRRAARITLVMGGPIVLAAAAPTLAFPAVAAVACPSYGLEPLEGEIFVDRTMPPRHNVAAALTQARHRVQDFCGGLYATPRVLICATDACYRRIGGGGSRGMALLDIARLLPPRGITPIIAAHELSHIDRHARLGLVGTMRRDRPQWFDKGVAVNVSDDPRYLAPSPTGNRCLTSSDEPLPTTRGEWVERPGNDQFDKKAAGRVSRWMAARGGAKAVVDVIGAVASGTSFERAYRQ